MDMQSFFSQPQFGPTSILSSIFHHAWRPVFAAWSRITKGRPCRGPFAKSRRHSPGRNPPHGLFPGHVWIRNIPSGSLALKWPGWNCSNVVNSVLWSDSETQKVLNSNIRTSKWNHHPWIYLFQSSPLPWDPRLIAQWTWALPSWPWLRIRTGVLWDADLAIGSSSGHPWICFPSKVLLAGPESKF